MPKRERDDTAEVETAGSTQPSAEKDGFAKYTLGNVLGAGSFAVVRRVNRKSDGMAFAMKLVKKQSTSAASAANERKVLSKLGLHRHIVSLIDHFDHEEAFVFVLELAEGGEVFDSICENGPYSEAQAADVIRQVALALAFMHALGVVHRDLKPENLLLKAPGSSDIKLADFGLACFFGPAQPPMRDGAGTVPYMAPEMIASATGAGGPYGPEVDLFSLGNIMFTLLGAYNAFDPLNDRTDAQVMDHIRRDEWSFDAYPEVWKHVSEGAKSVIRDLLQPTAARRLTADGVLQRTWVSGDASGAPIVESQAKLQSFNAGRKVWRAATHAAAVFLRAPCSAAHAVSNSPPKRGRRAKASAAKASAAKASASDAADASAVDASAAASSFGTAALAASASSTPPALPASVQAELRTAFDLFDLDSNGLIDEAELRLVVSALGADESEASRILREADTDGDGVISFAEFAALVRPLYDESGEALRRAFEMFDADGSGFIDRSELSLMLRKLGFEWQGTNVFRAADTDGDGKVSFDEFVAAFQRVAVAAPGGAAPGAAQATNAAQSASKLQLDADKTWWQRIFA